MTDRTTLRVEEILEDAFVEAYGLDGVRERDLYDWERWGDPSDTDLAECDFRPEDAPRLRALLTVPHSTDRDLLVNEALQRIDRVS